MSDADGTPTPDEDRRLADLFRRLDDAARATPAPPDREASSWTVAAPPAPAGAEPDDEDDGPLRFREPAPRPPRTTRARIADGIALGLRTVGEIAMTLGVVILLFVVYELYFTGIATHRDQQQLQHAFDQTKGTTPSATPNLGDGIAEIYAPRLGASWHFVVVEGTGPDQLAKGPGHYDYDAGLAKALGVTTGPHATKPLSDGSYPSAFPGQLGNFVVSGHRTTHAHPFFNANEFQPGDAIVVETSTTWYVYRVTGSTSVLPGDVDVAYPVPGKAGAVPTQKLLTLTTCNPRYKATHRLVISAVLASQQPLSAGDPAALKTNRT